MATTYVKNNVHLIFHIKYNGTKMRKEDLSRIFSYLSGIIRSFEGIPIEIGGQPDHIHILTSSPKTISLSDFCRLIKANSSKWVKTVDPYYRCFAWQDGYGAFSVSPSLIEKTINYIRNQEEHHKRWSFQEELKVFLEAYGIDYD